MLTFDFQARVTEEGKKNPWPNPSTSLPPKLNRKFLEKQNQSFTCYYGDDELIFEGGTILCILIILKGKKILRLFPKKKTIN